MPTDKEENNIVSQSRDNTIISFRQLSDFSNFFKDTIAIIDALSIDLFIREENYPDDQYMLSSICVNAKQQKKVPFDNGRLIFTKDLLNDCKSQPVSVTIYNNSNREKILASCKVCFLSQEQKELLLDMASYISTQSPDKSLKEVAVIVSMYSSNHFGKIYFPQIMNWLGNTRL